MSSPVTNPWLNPEYLNNPCRAIIRKTVIKIKDELYKQDIEGEWRPFSSTRTIRPRWWDEKQLYDNIGQIHVPSHPSDQVPEWVDGGVSAEERARAEEAPVPVPEPEPEVIHLDSEGEEEEETLLDIPIPPSPHLTWFSYYSKFDENIRASGEEHFYDNFEIEVQRIPVPRSFF